MRNDQVQTSTMHSVTETGGYNHHNNHRWTTLETGSRTLLLLLFSVRCMGSQCAAHQKSSGGPGAALQGIHDFVQLQGCAEIVRAAKVATSTFPCDNYSRFRRVGTKEGEAPRGTPATEKKDYESTVAGFWWSRMMPVRATILIPLLGPNPTAPIPSLFPMRRSHYRR